MKRFNSLGRESYRADLINCIIEDVDKKERNVRKEFRGDILRPG